jgi:naphthalene 1,2-dioxygenase system ferredoxin subunit
MPDDIDAGRWVRAADRAELREGDVVAARVEGRELALYLVGGEPHATDDLCTHGNARLSEGFVMDDCIECPLHQGQFDIRTGAPLCDPVTEPIRVYPVRFVGDELQVALPE